MASKKSTSVESKGTAKVSKCSTTREKFEKATPLTVDIQGNKMFANVKHYDSGSFGWYANGKIVVEVNGEPVEVQVGLILTVPHSKELPR